MNTTSLSLPEDIANRLSVLSRRTGRPETYYIVEAVREHLDDLEDAQIAEQRLADLQEGRSATVSSDEVEAMLRVDD